MAEVTIVVAHPGDELVEFSSVLDGARVVIAAEPEQLRELVDPRSTVFTHDPLDPNIHHRDVALAVARAFEEIWVPARSAPPVLLHALDAAAFARKLERINREVAPSHPHPSHPDDGAPPIACELTASRMSAIEAFVPARREDVLRAMSLTHYDLVLTEVGDTWGFENSAYERERFEATMAIASGLEGVATIVELGACEGLMTSRLCDAYPRARVTAIEPNPEFRARLSARLGARIQLEPRPIEDLPALGGDLILAAEVLYYAAQRLPSIASKFRGRWLVTSHHGMFDEKLAALLRGLGWIERKHTRLPIRFERVGPFMVRRVGCTIRLWEVGDARL